MSEQPQPVPTHAGRWRAADGRTMVVYPDAVGDPQWNQFFRERGPWVFVQTQESEVKE